MHEDAGTSAKPSPTGDQHSRVPSITLPKGGGALRSIDEKFHVNAANGTLELAFPIPSSTARSGIGTGIDLRYSSGSGNGPFGLGWSVSLPSIQRRTDKQVPRYADADESDVFVIAGVEDLVPAYTRAADGSWTKEVAHPPGFTVTRYRPRIEGAFSRIERIAVDGEAGFYWKVTSRDNVVTIYGRTAAARIADAAGASRIFRWLPEWTYDDKGNCAEYVYKAEDLANIPSAVNEQNRISGLTPIVNRYLKRIRYGNQKPYDAGHGAPYDPAPPAKPGYFFETVFDYGEHDLDAPAPAESATWPCRFDPVSDCRAGFEIRTYRLCRRILHFHTFAELDFAPDPYLVRSMDFSYNFFAFSGTAYVSRETDYITSLVQRAYKKAGAAAYRSSAWPSIDFSYQPLAWNEAVRTIAPDDVVGAPGGVGDGYQWIDLYADGMTGILTEQASAWFYKVNLGDGHFERALTVVPKPSAAGLAPGGLQLQDLDADGSRQVVVRGADPHGYFALSDDNEWQPFRSFASDLTVDVGDPNARFIDLTGDGKPDLVLSEDRVFTWYPSLGTGGFDAPFFSPKPWDENTGPAILFADGTETVFIADMNGDSLAEIVRVRNGEVCYWPNLGYGKFGAKVSMANAPHFDLPDRFDPKRIQFADVSGTGAADLVYLGRGGFSAWINLAGNAWSDPRNITPFPGTEQPNRVSVLDLLGNGTASLVWSSDLPANAAGPLRYVDLMGGSKPYVMNGYTDNLGKNVAFEYKSSNYYALRDRAAGKPWATKLPFPTTCLSRVHTSDSVSGARLVQSYRYRHGYYDHAEREFRGFGMVEQTDAETFEKFAPSATSKVVDASIDQPPVRTRTWFHTGAYLNSAGILHQFAQDYYVNPAVPEAVLPDPVIEAPPGYVLTTDEYREAARACKGMTLRQETYADDGTLDAPTPYSTAEHNCYIRLLQPQLGNRHAVFVPVESEAITYTYERNSNDPRVAHVLHTAIDELGNVLESASVAYGRVTADMTLPSAVQDAQRGIRVIYTANTYTNDAIDATAYRLRLLAEAQTFELSEVKPAATYFTPAEIRSRYLGAAPIGYERTPAAGFAQNRALTRRRILYAADLAPDAPLALRMLQPRGLTYQELRLAFTPSLLQSLYGTKVNAAMLAEGAYVSGDATIAGGIFPATDPAGLWWSGAGTVQYPPDPAQTFYLPTSYTDPFGNVTHVHYYSTYALLIDRITDPLGNPTIVEEFDFRFLLPRSVMDINQNITDVAFDIRGMVVGTALRGKGSEADDLTGFQADLTPVQSAAFLADPIANGAALLANATTRFVYSFAPLPAVAASIERESHAKAAQASGTPSPLRYAFAYSDGFGHVAMTKTQAEPGKAMLCTVAADGRYTLAVIDTTPNVRWIGSGRTILNNKGNPVMKYEPYFSTTQAYEDAEELVATGVTPVMTYDAPGRLVRTDFPDATYSYVAFDPWAEQRFDQNDTVLSSGWYAARAGGALGSAAQAAATRTAVHDGTPLANHVDSLGRSIYSVADNRFTDRTTALAVEEFYDTLSAIDVQGNTSSVTDPRGNTVMRSAYDMLSRACATVGMDGGPRWTFQDTTGKPLYGWDAKGNRFQTRYDALRRPVQHEVLDAAATTTVYDKSVYGSDVTKNQNGELIERFDKSGTSTRDAYDFKRNVLSTTRAFTVEYANTIDWSIPAAVPLKGAFRAQSTYDALNRVISATSADGSVTANTYGAAGLLSAVGVSIRGAAPQPFIVSITHDAQGRRLAMTYGNGAVTTAAYDPQTFRLTRVLTVRSDNATLQDLNYTYDPVGNVTTIVDAAQQTYFFNNQVVPPRNDFVYDAVYWLRAATGREQVAQNAPVDQFDAARSNEPLPSDGSAMQRYLQQYDYDAAANMLAMAHNSGIGPFVNTWTRLFTPESGTNRLASSHVGGTNESYAYDVHGNLTSLPGIAPLDWDFDDQLRSADLVGGGTAYYTYDAAGNRIRKVIERQGGIIEERLYLGSLELFTRTNGGLVSLQRQSLHVLDGDRRLALIDTRLAGDDGTLPQLVRYQFSNHLDTAVLELDDRAAVITYEEYYPFGSTSFEAVDSTREVPAKRYRYTGKERDEETGFSYHGARYYAPWIARWTSCDPAGLADGVNLFGYARNNPVRLADPHGTQGSDPQKPPAQSGAAAQLSADVQRGADRAQQITAAQGIPHFRPHIALVPQLHLNPPVSASAGPPAPIPRPDDPRPAAPPPIFPPVESTPVPVVEAPTAIFSSWTNSSSVLDPGVANFEFNQQLAYGSAGTTVSSQLSGRLGVAPGLELGFVGNLALTDPTTGAGGVTVHVGASKLNAEHYTSGGLLQVTGGRGQDPSGGTSGVLSALASFLAARGGDTASEETDLNAGVSFTTLGNFGGGSASVPHLLSVPLLAARTWYLDPAHANSVYLEGQVAPSAALDTLRHGDRSLYGARVGAGSGFSTTATDSLLTFSANAFVDLTSQGVGAGGMFTITYGAKATFWQTSDQ